ncbi:MAG: hypothetical protein KA243_05995 [Candidatus Aminicenantes bacterium]|nr:hypothetical protein [Candidatus Aminicenantes bacterium]
MKIKARALAPVATAVLIVPLLASLPRAQAVLEPDLRAVPGGGEWTVVNRAVTVTERDGRTVAEFDARPGDGMARFDGAAFALGEIECDIQGRGTPVQGSFVGLAFGVRDAETFDAVYFRPFNFRSEDPARRARSVQYVSHPEWTWPRLRQERPGAFEKAVEPSPDPDRWFHVRIVVGPADIRVFVDGAGEPCLTVPALSGPRTGAVALWVGNNSPGRFAGLKIRPAAARPGAPPVP